MKKILVLAALAFAFSVNGFAQDAPASDAAPAPDQNCPCPKHEQGKPGHHKDSKDGKCGKEGKCGKGEKSCHKGEGKCDKDGKKHCGDKPCKKGCKGDKPAADAEQAPAAPAPAPEAPAA